MSSRKTSEDVQRSGSDQLDAVLARHRAFWTRTPMDRPLLRMAPWTDWQPYAAFVRRDGTELPDGAEITPGLLDPIATSAPYRPRELFDGDFINGWGPFDSCWTEAMVGCRILRSGPSVWNEPFLDDWTQADSLLWDGSNAWLEELLNANRALLSSVAGAYPVCQPLMRGPLDMVEAAVPTDILYPGFYDHPDQLRKLLEHCTDIFVAVAERRLAETPPWNGGYMVRYEWGLWAPGTTVQFQADAMRNLSPRMYRDFLSDLDRRVARGFEYSIIHTHSGSAHILPVLVDETELGAIEVTLDPAPYGPPPLHLLSKFEMIQQSGKSLLISGPIKRSDLDTILETLSPIGLAVRAGLL